MYQQDFTIIKGETFYKEISITVNGEIYPLDGFLAISQIRPYAGSSTLIENFDCEIDNDKGIIKIKMDNNKTNNLPKGTQYYDILLINEGTQEYSYFIGGKIFVKNHVTELSNGNNS